MSLRRVVQSPFPGEEEEEVFDSIVNEDVQYPAALAPDAVVIMKKVSMATLKMAVTHNVDYNIWSCVILYCISNYIVLCMFYCIF